MLFSDVLMKYNDTQVNLIFTLFKLQNGNRHFSEFVQLAKNQEDIKIKDLELGDGYVKANFKNKRYIFNYTVVLNFIKWNFKINKYESFNPFDYISFEDKI